MFKNMIRAAKLMSRLDRYLAVTLVLLIAATLVSILSAAIFFLDRDTVLKTGIDVFYIVYLPFLSVLLIVIFSSAFGLATLYIKTVLEKIARPVNLEEILQFDPVCLQCIPEDERRGILDQLEAEKRRINHIINLAESKYHTHKLDESSFHEIVMEQQKKLMDIETKMAQILKQLEAIERRGKGYNSLN